MPTPLEIAEALVQSLPEEIQQSGGDPIKIDMIEIDFDPDCEAATDNPTSFWFRTDDGETFSCLVTRQEEYTDDSMPAESQIYPLDR